MVFLWVPPFGFFWKKKPSFLPKTQHWNRLGVPMDPFPFQRFCPLWGSAGFPRKKECNFLNFPIPDSDLSLLKITREAWKQKHIYIIKQPAQTSLECTQKSQGFIAIFECPAVSPPETSMEVSNMSKMSCFSSRSFSEPCKCWRKWAALQTCQQKGDEILPPSMWLTLTSIFNLWWNFPQTSSQP